MSAATTDTLPSSLSSLHCNGAPPPGNPSQSRDFMILLVGSQAVVGDALFADYNPISAFLFPGQGVQAVGLGKEAQAVPAAAQLYKANDIIGLAPVELLRAHDGGQQIMVSVDVTCGVSLEGYTALPFAEAFSFEDGLKLVKLRGEAMQEASDAKSAIIELDSEKVQQLCDAANQEVDVAEKVPIANNLCPVKEKDTACKNLGTLWDDLGKAMEGEDEIEIGEVDCGVSKPVCTKVDIHSYPTFKLFYDGEEVAKYQEKNTPEQKQGAFRR
ncbi:hypothetical protein COLO4_24546 [Corchorus olitorius]|uniref:Thioredoxin domain-containing protein n=1 Tax=Corchorus olitorius TaxID=93759 RepID=A0A1R3I965_9ROSI|nr:hypothetical protein COLO4_24546 [Corchorus olitorius]